MGGPLPFDREPISPPSRLSDSERQVLDEINRQRAREELQNLLKTVIGTADWIGQSLPERRSAQAIAAHLGGPADPLSAACDYLREWLDRNHQPERGRVLFEKACLDAGMSPDQVERYMRRLQK